MPILPHRGRAAPTLSEDTLRKHRRKTYHRQIIVAAVAVSAVAVPSAAMACLDDPRENTHNRPQSHGETAQTPTASPSTAKTTSAPASGTTARVVELVNAERKKAGCSPLTVNAKLTKAAQDHSADMAQHKNMSHTGSDGSEAGDRITRAGYNWSTYGENVAEGYDTAERVMEGWMSSSGHKRNILNCSFKEIGVGLAQPGNYWTQDFAAAR